MSLISSTYFHLYHDLFNGLTLQETTHYPTQIDSMGLTPFEILDEENIHMEDREDKVYSDELINSMPYQPFSWDIGNSIVDLYQSMSSSFSSSFLINNESSCSGIPLMNIIDTSGSQHCLEITSHTMVDASLCRSFVFTNLFQVNGYLKCESREACQGNEALWSMPMVMSGPYSFSFFSGMNKFISTNILSLKKTHMYLMHGSYLVCYFPLNSLH
jgi:hypothetical protein